MNCNTTHYRANSSSVPGDPTDQCKQLLDHLVDLEFKKAGATGSDAVKAELTKQKQAVSEARQAEFLEACVKRTARVRVECALGAGDLEAVARCDEAK